MKSLLRLKLAVVVILLMLSSTAFGISVTAPIDTVAIGATVNAHDGDHHFLQSLIITLDGGVAWNAGDDITITMPTGISVADPDGDASYDDGISISWTATNNIGAITVESATVSLITINVALTAAVTAGDKLTVIFPITTSASATDGSSVSYTVAAVGGGETTTSATATVYFRDTLNLVSFAAAYAGGDDTTNTQGNLYPASGGAVAITGTLTDWVTDQSSGATDGVVNGADASFEGITLDNDDTSDEITYTLWASKLDTLKKISGVSADILVAYNEAGSQITDNEDGTMNGDEFDPQSLEEGDWYFYVTTNLTADWVVGQSAMVHVRHYPTFAASNNTDVGVDYDDDGTFEPSSGGDDDKSSIALDGSGALGKNDAINATGNDANADNVDLYAGVIDYDDAATVQFFRSTTDDITSSSIVTAGSSPSLTVASLTGATEITTTALRAESPYTIHNFDAVTTADTVTAGTYYIYVVTNDGKHQALRQMTNYAGTDLTLKVKYFPYFIFDDGYYSGNKTINTENEQYYVINWGRTISMDNDIDATSANPMRIKLYVSDLSWALAGGHATATAVDTTLLPTDATADTDNTILIASLVDTSDTQTQNRYMWDVRNSSIEAKAGYYIYAIITSNGDAAVVTLNSDENMLEGTQRSLTVAHGTYFMPEAPVEGETVSLGLGDTYDLRWNAFDMDATASKLVQAFMVPTGTSIATTVTWTVAAAYAVDDYYWLLPTTNGQDATNATTGATASDGKYTLDVSSITTQMDADATAPSGTYDVYFFYTSDGTCDAETVQKADGTLYFSGATDQTSKYNFRLQPTQVVLTKGDTVTVSVIATDPGSPDPMALNVYLDVPATNFTIVDQDASASGTNPFTEVTTTFNGSLTKNTSTLSNNVYQLDLETHNADYSGTSVTNISIATFQLIAKNDASGSVLDENIITFNTSGSRTTKMVDATFTDFGRNVSPNAAYINLAPRGTISGFVDIQGVDDDSGKTVTFHVTNSGSYTCITDSIFLAENSDTDASDGIQVTLGDNGGYTLDAVPNGKYDVICEKPGWLTQRETQKTIQAYSATSVNFNNANKLYAGDAAGYDDDGSSSTVTLPDNQINSTDTDVFEDAFDATSSDANWNAYCDINADDLVDLVDIQWPAINSTAHSTGEGIQYKRLSGGEDEPLAKLVMLQETDDQLIYAVTVENFPLLHSYDVRLYINDAQWELVSYENKLQSTQNIFFTKRHGYNNLFVSATLGTGVSPEINQTLLSFKLKKQIANPAKPKLTKVTLIDVFHQVNTPTIYVNVNAMESDALPKDYSLSQNYPNPFNPTTAIRFGLPKSGNVKLVVYNMLGQEIRSLISGKLEAGNYKAFWDGNSASGISVATGIYLYRIEIDNKVIHTRKMLLLK